MQEECAHQSCPRSKAGKRNERLSCSSYWTKMHFIQFWCRNQVLKQQLTICSQHFQTPCKASRSPGPVPVSLWFDSVNVKLVLQKKIEIFNLESLILTVPRWLFEGNGRPFVLFIDEANKLSSLAERDNLVHVSFNVVWKSCKIWSTCRQLECSWISYC